jgi:hypothetical protein
MHVLPSIVSFLVAIVFAIAPERTITIAIRTLVIMWALGIG